MPDPLSDPQARRAWEELEVERARLQAALDNVLAQQPLDLAAYKQVRADLATHLKKVVEYWAGLWLDP